MYIWFCIFFLQKELQTYQLDFVCKWILHDNNIRRQKVLDDFKLIWLWTCGLSGFM